MGGWKLHSDGPHIGLANLCRQFGEVAQMHGREIKRRFFEEISGCDKCEF